ncbi:unnamed protein product [Clonostachys rosea f. rosea IK726]|uniref:Uncharacterized protein n=1 Tax=Clonostachys rosea f. rosea IK726 TaxID=1349383 RepID=A0ACA9TYY3_BIOOC|nr:unnamed protein product [Clonostachys rosea f. rosea IK726]
MESELKRTIALCHTAWLMQAPARVAELLPTVDGRLRGGREKEAVDSTGSPDSLSLGDRDLPRDVFLRHRLECPVGRRVGQQRPSAGGQRICVSATVLAALQNNNLQIGVLAETMDQKWTRDAATNDNNVICFCRYVSKTISL